MRKSTLTILQFFIVTILSAQHNVRITIDSLPSLPRALDLYIAGSFNSWNPGNEQYRFQRMENGEFYIDLKLPAGTYEYKITRGSWKDAECNANGAGKENRLLKVFKDELVVISIAGWKDNFPDKVIKHSASNNVKIIDTAFYIPQLKRKRRVWVYLPENYKQYSYPVLYMQDGQNVFDDATAYAGEWGVDEFLDSAILKSCIVVAIDNGGDKRLNEYCPYDMAKFGKGEGGQYVDFLVKTLKPYIDKKYRTLKDSKHTFIAGSSMGGLISMYAILKYPKVFGGAGVFSPAFWVGPQIFDDIIKKGTNVKGKIYFYAGKQEGETMVPDMLKAFERMVSVSKSKMTTVIRDDGKHNEPTWRKEFPLFYEWILK